MIEWFDDLALGMRFKSAEKLVTREDIKRFAAEFDPQPYHLDEAAAEKTALQGLAASGWHTAAIAMRLATDARPFGPPPRRAPHRGRGGRARAVEDQAAGDRQGQMDRVQPARRAGLHLYADRDRAAPAGLIGLRADPGKGLDSGVGENQ